MQIFNNLIVVAVATMAEDVVVVSSPMLRVHQTPLYVRYASNRDILPENAITVLISLIKTNKLPKISHKPWLCGEDSRRCVRFTQTEERVDGRVLWLGSSWYLF